MESDTIIQNVMCFIVCQFSSAVTKFPKILFPTLLLVSMKYQPPSFCIQKVKAGKETPCSLHTLLLLAGSPPWSSTPTLYGSCSSCQILIWLL